MTDVTTRTSPSGPLVTISIPAPSGPVIAKLAAPLHITDGNPGTVFTVPALSVPANLGFFASIVMIGGEGSGPGNVLTATLEVFDNGVSILQYPKLPVESGGTPGANVNAFFGDQENVAWSLNLAYATAAVVGPLTFRVTPVGADLDIEANITVAVLSFISP